MIWTENHTEMSKQAIAVIEGDICRDDVYKETGCEISDSISKELEMYMSAKKSKMSQRKCHIWVFNLKAGVKFGINMPLQINAVLWLSLDYCWDTQFGAFLLTYSENKRTLHKLTFQNKTFPM